MIKEIKESLKELGFGESEIKVYVALTQLGEAGAAQIAKKADLPRTTAISVLNKLKEDGYITTHIYRGTTYYWVESPKKIANVLEHRISVANDLGEMLSDLYREEAHFPVAQIFDTKTGIKKAIEKMLTNLDKKSTIYTIDTPAAGNYTRLYTTKSENNIMSIKKNRDVTTHTLIPFGARKDITPEKIKRQPIEIREMPEGLKFEGSLWIAKDLIAHFSGKPPFLITIKHEKIVAGIKGIYNFLWSISKEV